MISNLSYLRQETFLEREYYADSADLDQMMQKAASDQGQHCLLTKNFMENTIKVKLFTCKYRNGLFEVILWISPLVKERLFFS